MLIVSNYHYIRNSFENKYPSIYGLTPKQFKSQLEQLSQYGTFISQQDLLSFRGSEFDKNYILITFDDGLAEQYELARPILNQLGIPYVFFINSMNHVDREVSLVHKIHLVRSQMSSSEILKLLSSNSDIVLTDEEQKMGELHYNYDDKASAHLKYILNFKLNYDQQKAVINPLFNNLFNEEEVLEQLYFNKGQLQVLHKEGVLGAHSHRHVPLGLLDEAGIEEELLNSQNFFQSEFKEKAFSISYPYGSKEACNKVTAIANKMGFKLGFSMERATTTNLIDNPLMISRYDCNDLPGGKFNLFKNSCIFKESKKSNWYR